MNIYVSVKCRDTTIQINVGELLKYNFFNNYFKCTTTQVKHERMTITNSDGLTQNVDTFTIPEIEASSLSGTLIRLVNKSIPLIESGSYNEELLDLIQYNSMYEFYHVFRTLTYKEPLYNNYFDLLTYVKEKKPQFNVFRFFRIC